MHERERERERADTKGFETLKEKNNEENSLILWKLLFNRELISFNIITLSFNDSFKFYYLFLFHNK